ncbi:MAG: 2'-5' RNA ligase family protein [Actinomycetota bacterium]
MPSPSGASGAGGDRAAGWADAEARLGVALLLPPPLASEVDALRKALGDPGLGLIPPHLTLVPPVNLPPQRWDHAVAILSAAGRATRPFTVRLGAPRSFLPGSPTVYLPVGDDTRAPVDALRALVFRDPLERPLT